MSSAIFFFQFVNNSVSENILLLFPIIVLHGIPRATNELFDQYFVHLLLALDNANKTFGSFGSVTTACEPENDKFLITER